MHTAPDFPSKYVADILRTFKSYKKLADEAITQVGDDAALSAPLGSDDNSIAIIVQHVAGNLRSRFTDFLTTDGEKPDRDRDGEFEAQGLSRAALMSQWEAAWAITLDAIGRLSAADAERTVTIRGEAFDVFEALDRAVTHTAYHVGQIVLLAKHLAGDRWTSLSIPKGQSAAYARGTYKDNTIPRQR
jgi:hypothetical protein